MNRRKFIAGLAAVAGMQVIGNVRIPVRAEETYSDYVVREYQYGYDAVEALYKAHKDSMSSLDTLFVNRIDIRIYEVTLKCSKSGLAMVPHIIECGDTAIMRIPSNFYTSYNREIYDAKTLTRIPEYARIE